MMKSFVVLVESVSLGPHDHEERDTCTAFGRGG